MAQDSTIQWTDATWNPVTGCTKVSPGCAHCYAETISKRFWKSRSFDDVRTHTDRIDTPLHWKKPRMIFVNSMSDLFHEDVPDDFIDKVFATMALCQRHTFQILTKRPRRMVSYCSGASGGPPGIGILPNVWLGVSVEDQKRADERIPLLMQTPAAVRFLSVEPLLSEVKLSLCRGCYNCGYQGLQCNPDWIIVGGESGPGARPCNVAWIRSIVEECRAAGVACFVKQLGGKPYSNDDKIAPRGLDEKQVKALMPERRTAPVFFRCLNDSQGGDLTEWPADLRVREFPKSRIAT